MQAVTSGRPGPVGFLDVALVQAAVHDAVQAIEGRFEPYHAAILKASGSPAAAVAAAAHGVLVGIYPAQQAALDVHYVDFLLANNLMGDPGLIAGQEAAAALLSQYRPAPDPPLPGGGRLGNVVNAGDQERHRLTSESTVAIRCAVSPPSLARNDASQDQR